MHILISIFVLCTFILTPCSSATPLQEAHLLKRLRQNDAGSPQEYFEVFKPIPFDSSGASCSLPILSYDFGNTPILAPITANYSAPPYCKWTHVILEIHVSSQGKQYDRIAGVWLDGAELIRTSSAEPTANGIFWNVRKDVTRYSSLLAQEKLTLSVMIENLAEDVYAGVYTVNITFFYYDVNAVDSPLYLPSDQASFDLYDKPADLIIPISADGFGGYWFGIENGSETRSVEIQIPPNTYKAVVEVFVSFHGDDEFWYSNLPDSYLELNKLSTKRGNGSYREVLLTIDGKLVGAAVPFPVIYPGGINPLFWQPVVSIGAFNLPTYDFDVTPFLGLVLDGKMHSFGLSVAESLSFWLVDANLHLWLDEKATEVQAGADYKAPEFSTDREFEYHGLEGTFQIKVQRKSKITGWVNSTSGNFTTEVSQELESKNEIEIHNDGRKIKVDQRVKEKTEARVLSTRGSVISRKQITREYKLKIKTETKEGYADATYLKNTELDNELKEEKSDGHSQSKLSNRQECEGWVFKQGHDVVSGAGSNRQNYKFRDGKQCYSRQVKASNGKVLTDNDSFRCVPSF